MVLKFTRFRNPILEFTKFQNLILEFTKFQNSILETGFRNLTLKFIESQKSELTRFRYPVNSSPEFRNPIQFFLYCFLVCFNFLISL